MRAQGVVSQVVKVTLLLAAVAVIAVGVGVAVRSASSDEPNPVANFDVTPIAYVPLTVTPPDTANPAKCQFPDDERPAPGLPELPCRHEIAEPPPDAIPTAEASPVVKDPAPGHRIVDNAAFRFTIEVPDDWYANMRPEGGEFYILDPVALEQDHVGRDLPGGVIIHFTADEFRSLEEFGPRPAEYVPEINRHLEQEPHNTVFGDYTGATWEVSGEEGLARILRAAFVRDGVVFEIQVNLGLGASPEQAKSDADAAVEMISSITPY